MTSIGLLLTQAGTAVPTASVVENSVGKPVTMTRQDVGLYRIGCTAAFPSGKVFSAPVVQPNDAALLICATMSRYSDDAVSVHVIRTDTGADIDLATTNFPIWIDIA